MKKTIIIIAIVSMLLAMIIAGCRAAPQVPGVTALQSVMPTLPGVSPSPAGQTYGGGVTTKPTVLPAATIPTARATVGKSTKP